VAKQRAANGTVKQIIIKNNKMGKAEKYNLKEAYNKNLNDKARLHYLKNYEHDSHSRKGGSGSYTGNHPKFTSPVGMAGQLTGQMPTQTGVAQPQTIVDPTQIGTIPAQNIINANAANTQPQYSAQEQIAMANTRGLVNGI